MNYDDDIRRDLHVGARDFRENCTIAQGTRAVDGFDFAEKMICAWRPVTVTPQRRAFCKASSCAVGSPMSAGRKNPNAEFFSSGNGECHGQLGRKASPN